MAGLATAFGSGAMTNSIEEIGGASSIFAIGTNTTSDHPVIALEIKKAVRNGGKLIVADPRRIELCDIADIWLQHRPGTDVALMMGMMKVIVDEGLHDKEFIDSRCENFDEFKEALAEFELTRVSEITGVPAEDIAAAARIYATSKPSSILYCMGITQHTHGTDNVLCIANLAMLTGNIGKLSTGVNPLRGQNNVQGACDLGALPNVYTSYQQVANDEAREKFEKAWGVDLPAEPGLVLTDMFHAMEEGTVKAAYLMGENPLLSDPDTKHIKEALGELEFFVVQDIFLTETAELADVVLPAASFAEKEGTFSNTERRVQRVRKAFDPPGEARPDWEIICDIARRLGAKGFEFREAEDIFKEIARLSPSYAGISYERLDNEGGIQWPCPTGSHPGTKFLHSDQFTRGKGRFSPLTYRESAELPDSEYPLILTTGRSPYHYHTATMTRKAAGLNYLGPEEMIWINPEDAASLGVNHGDWVKVTSRRGSLKVRADVTGNIQKGVVFMTFHYAEACANVLTNSALDPVCKTPEFKVCAVKVEKGSGVVAGEGEATVDAVPEESTIQDETEEEAETTTVST